MMTATAMATSAMAVRCRSHCLPPSAFEFRNHSRNSCSGTASPLVSLVWLGKPILGSMDALSDEELIAQYCLAPASDRSRQLLDELFGRHRPRVVGWCFRLTSYRELAADLAQDGFVK